MARLLVFNPQHDYAMANGTPYYKPPKSIHLLAKALQFLPLVWSKEDDLILLADNRIYNIATAETFDPKSDSGLNLETVAPWGWDSELKHRLLSLGIKDEILPSDAHLSEIRRLSHRRISIDCNTFLASNSIPSEFFTECDAMKFAADNPGCYFKLPWSSGGRGVVDTGELNHDQISQWIHGSVRKQKSVLAERRINPTLLFASLWQTDGNQISFQGVSISLSDGRGKYKGNVYGPQERLRKIIESLTPTNLDEIIQKQSRFINEYIVPGYIGPIGIDMMADTRGTVFPCVEINLRYTMGHVAMLFSDLPLEKKRTVTALCKLPLIDVNDYK